MEITNQDIYRIVFKEYPDVLDAKQVSQVLGISVKTVYKLIRTGDIPCLRVGREYRIPKVNLMTYMKVLSQKDQ